MAFVNNTMIIRRELLTRIAALVNEGKIEQEIDRIPLLMSKIPSQATDRCCKHKLRAVAKYKIMGLLGYGIEEETDELMPLKDYYDLSVNQEISSPRILTVVDEACTSCVKTNYVVTNLCKGCIAQPCLLNCPKKAVFRHSNGKAEIDPEKCVSCGLCKELCPYHAIIYMPVPCEESCPAGAIHKDNSGREVINEEKCILCGKCVNACPFGSIMEHSQLFGVMKELKKGTKMVALPAPSVSGQFSCKDIEIFGALTALGFDQILEVSQGATLTANAEAKELDHELQEGKAFLSNSCCPAWVEAARKIIPEMAPFISSTPTPLAYAAHLAKEKWPDHKTVFIGPCIAKRKEGKNNPNVDYVLTFEELGCWMDGWGIEPEKEFTWGSSTYIPPASKGFAVCGGVACAVQTLRPETTTAAYDGLDKKTIALLKSFALKKSAPAEFIEVMSCKGGCIAGPSAHQYPKDALKIFENKKEG